MKKILGKVKEILIGERGGTFTVGGAFDWNKRKPTSKPLSSKSTKGTTNPTR